MVKNKARNLTTHNIIQTIKNKKHKKNNVTKHINR